MLDQLASLVDRHEAGTTSAHGLVDGADPAAWLTDRLPALPDLPPLPRPRPIRAATVTAGDQGSRCAGDLDAAMALSPAPRVAVSPSRQRHRAGTTAQMDVGTAAPTRH